MKWDEREAEWTDSAISFAIRALRDIYLSYPPQARDEVRERARRLAAEQPRSYLAKHIEEIYR